ncbi:MAG: DUF1501 domain-containing protein [Myxococcaceae bacterium]|nr:DUF1501 domain-containing protein [Myxococcaceae bacterium]
MNLSRRQLLSWSLGASQVALLERAGLLGGRAHAQTATDAPSRLCVLYIPGGFRFQHCFWPGTDADVEKSVPPPANFNGEPIFFRANQLTDLGPANGPYNPVRLWRSWDPAAPQTRNSTFAPAMYGYTHFGLGSQLSVLHGIDQGTNDHASGFIAAACGVAGADFRAPAVHAVIANHLYNRFKDQRPLPFVIVDSSRGAPQAMGLPSRAAPVFVPSIDALAPQLSADPMENRWWQGLDARADRPEKDVRGMALGGNLKTTALEEYTLGVPGKYVGKSSPKVDTFLEGLHGSLSSVSRVLATDVVTVLEQTKGIDVLTANKPAYLSSYGLGAFGYTFGLANFHMTQLEPRLDMTLRLLKSNLATSVHCALAPDYDTHNGTGNASSCAHGRNLMDIVARFLGELKAAPAPGLPGKTLLDDTLVLVMSEFGRTWSAQSGSGYYQGDDHHPFTSVVFAGGNVAGNRSVGGFEVPRGVGVPVDIIEENGQPSRRVPRAADVVTTALRVMGMGLHDFFIPGGYGEVTGIRRG